MRKSSIYLPDELKGALSELALRTGRSEADLIRHAIERMVSVADTAAAVPVDDVVVGRARPSVVGVGVGPGDPGLITRRAHATLLAADRVVVISTDARSVGRAEMVARAAAPTAAIHRVPFAIGPDRDGRQASLADVGAAILAGTDAGEMVAVALIGDPMQWTIFADLADLVRTERPGLAIVAEPGITSYQAAAAAALVPLGRRGWPDGGPRRRGGPGSSPRRRRTLGGALQGLDRRGRAQGRRSPEREGRRHRVRADRPTRPARRAARGDRRRPHLLPGHRDLPGPTTGPDAGASVISFVGAGPGAPDLITLRGARLLHHADVVVWAASLVPDALLEHCRPDAVIHDSKQMTLDEVCAVFASHPDAAIVRLHSGDPTIYSAIGEQIAWCRTHGRAFEVIPGVSSVHASAAAAGCELTIPGVAQSVVMTRIASATRASMPDRETIEAYAATGATLALFLSVAHIDQLADRLLGPGSAFDPDTPVVVAHRVTWPDERGRADHRREGGCRRAGGRVRRHHDGAGRTGAGRGDRAAQPRLRAGLLHPLPARRGSRAWLSRSTPSSWSAASGGGVRRIGP